MLEAAFSSFFALSAALSDRAALDSDSFLLLALSLFDFVSTDVLAFEEAVSFVVSFVWLLLLGTILPSIKATIKKIAAPHSNFPPGLRPDVF